MDKYSPEERQQLILQLLKSHNKVIAADLAVQLGTTEATIRRDLRFLSGEGLCKRIHGGALSFAPPSGTQEERLENRNAEKQVLVLGAVKIIKEKQLIFLDASSTHMLLASILPDNMELTVVTNSPAIATRLLERKTIRTILIGGELDYAVGGAIDITAAEAINKFRFDLSFLGACAWSSETGFSAVHYRDREFKHLVVTRSGSIAVLCTDDKIEALASYPFLASQEIDYLICKENDSSLKNYFSHTECQLITC
ncbi:DeoR/GlpR family DNA-binding transcription regulator [Vibrio salinus]|uniref:DeoR/GlpR family DNA-binding transcription regulator n=1 Tax=Vibrio salinus TaxID=2899784 RepID=UPI001E4F68A4|nr:DeoR/GlpR family DNA-binding transcription regulator [Vibrio salinus]MCE0492739.1 DeoR/GlpR family DNA-binding transcription regulator [Vibrio salinus]